MRERLQQRLQQLKTEFESGQRMLAEIEQNRLSLEKTLLRISGAIQVLEEALAEAEGEAADVAESAAIEAGPVIPDTQSNGRAGQPTSVSDS